MNDLEDAEFIEKVSNKVYEHRNKRLRSNSSSKEDDEEIQQIKEIVRSEIDRAISSIDKSIQMLISRTDSQNSKLDKLVSQVDNQKKVITNIRLEVDTMREDQHKVNSEMKKEIKTNNKDVKTAKGQLIKVQEELEKVKFQNLAMQRKIVDTEARSRRNNLLFFGIAEGKDEDVEEKVLSFFKDTLNIEGDRSSFGIQRAHRLCAP